MRNKVDDQGGNNNQRLDPGESANLLVTLRNVGLDAGNVNAKLHSTCPYVEILDSLGFYGNIGAGDTALNSADPFALSARPETPHGTKATFSIALSYDGKAYADTESFKLTVGDLTCLPIPDNQRRYWAYDDTDADPQHPTYNWAEIRDIGTQLVLGDDQTVTIPLPFTFKYYGNKYSNLSICTNGWLAAGTTTLTDNLNFPLPDPHGPPAMLAPNWDDLFADSSHAIWYYHDVTNHRFIVEYDSLVYYGGGSRRDKFEVIIYDSTVLTPTGDNVILFQYRTANGFHSSTVGIEDTAQAVGIQHLYDRVYDQYAAPLGPGRAIKFTTTAPVRIEEPTVERHDRTKHFLTASPNPMIQSSRISFSVGHAGSVSLKVFDVRGRRVRTLVKGPTRAGRHYVAWNGVDDQGHKLGNGVYFITLDTPSEKASIKMILIR